MYLAKTSFLSTFKEETEDEVCQVIMKPATKLCTLDADTCSQGARHLACTTMKMINMSMSISTLLTQLLAKTTTDPKTLKNYRPCPIFLTCLMSERIVLRNLLDYLNITNQHESPQSSYHIIHSTEVTLVRVSNDTLITLDRHNSHTVTIRLMSSLRYDRPWYAAKQTVRYWDSGHCA